MYNNSYVKQNESVDQSIKIQGRSTVLYPVFQFLSLVIDGLLILFPALSIAGQTLNLLDFL